VVLLLVRWLWVLWGWSIKTAKEWLNYNFWDNFYQFSKKGFPSLEIPFLKFIYIQ
jgi:hypothetical protein